MSAPMCPRLPESVMCFTRCKPNTRGKNPAMPAKMPSAIASTIDVYKRQDLLGHGHRHVTTLLQELGHVRTAGQLILGSLVQILSLIHI